MKKVKNKYVGNFGIPAQNRSKYNFMLLISTVCPVGQYGINCSYNCSGHCAGSSSSLCYHSDGSCRDGCVAGWTGSVCDQGMGNLLG